MTIGKLNVILGLNNSKFNSGMDKSGKKTKEMTANTKAMAAQMAKTVGTITAVATAIVALGKKLYDFSLAQTAVIDADAKLATRLGMTTQEIREWSFVAEKAGVAGNSFTTSMQRMIRRISEASVKGGATRKALDELGLSADRLRTADPTSQMRMLAAAFDDVQIHADKTRLAMALFDTEGVANLQVFAGGLQGINKEMQRYREIAGQISAEDERRAAALQDMNLELETATKHLKEQLALLLSQPATAWAQGMTALIESNVARAQQFKHDPLAAGLNWLSGGMLGADPIQQQEERAIQNNIDKQKKKTEELLKNIADAGGVQGYLDTITADTPPEEISPLSLSMPPYPRGKPDTGGLEARIEQQRKQLEAARANQPETPPGYAIASGGRHSWARIMAAEGQEFRKQDPRLKEAEEANDHLEQMEKDLKDLLELQKMIDQRSMIEMDDPLAIINMA